jgi:RHS repeat-associated protein
LDAVREQHPEPTRISGHAVTRSVGGRVIDAWVDTGGFDLADANPAGDNYLYDGAGRLSTAYLPGGVATYSDALGRLTQRTQNTTTTRYSYNGYSDSPAAVLDSTNSLLQQFHTLPGGVLVTINHPGLTRTLSYPDLNGNYTTTTDHTGTPTATRVHYGPWGERLPSSTGTLDNASGNLDAGAFGQHGKLEEDTTQRTIITMGARPYSPRDGRFLTIDPIKGGCANNYTYGYGDPVNGNDLSGKNWVGDFVDWLAKQASCVGKPALSETSALSGLLGASGVIVGAASRNPVILFVSNNLSRLSIGSGVAATGIECFDGGGFDGACAESLAVSAASFVALGAPNALRNRQVREQIDLALSLVQTRNASTRYKC